MLYFCFYWPQVPISHIDLPEMSFKLCFHCLEFYTLMDLHFTLTHSLK